VSQDSTTKIIEIEFTSRAEMLEKLSELAVAPPSGDRRSSRERKHRAETWAMSKLLSTLALNNEISYPCLITHQDCPDFVVEMKCAKISIEVTEAVNRDYMHVQSMKRKRGASHPIEMSNFRYNGELHQNRKDVLAEGPTKAGAGWTRGQKEEEFVAGIRRSADTKKEKLRRALPGTGKFDKHVLVICNNLPPLIDDDAKESVLRGLLDRGWSIAPFDEIFVLSDRSVFRMKMDGSLARYETRDLRSGQGL